MFLLFFLFSNILFAQVNCELFKGRACVYLPQGPLTQLHLYHRGHHKGMRDFETAERGKVARMTLESPIYKLRELADKRGLVTVVSGSSAVAFTLEDIKQLEQTYHTNFLSITLSAHSGGYYGLNKTLSSLSPLKNSIHQIMMLDNFYATTDEKMLKNLREYQANGVFCRGFMTLHNVERVKKFYQKNGLDCEVEGPAGMDHNSSVNSFLKKHL
jgi:hypothetical protein